MIVENQILIELLSDVDNWSDLKVKLEKFNTSQTETTNKKTQAGKIFELFTKYYLQTDTKKTELYKKVWLYDEISIDIKENLRLPSIDHGIDILLQDFDNNFHAVQCKFKNDESKSLSWSGDKIANVFALGTNCHKIIVFTNASDTTSVAKAFEEKFEQIAFDELNSIEPEIFNSIYDLARGNHPKELIKHTPKEHQKNAIEKVVLHFENNSRGQLILPCGAGKTVTALWIKEEIKSKATLVLVPSLALLKQIKNDWARHKSYLYSYLCVCSEKDIDNDQEDSVRLHTYEIGGPVTTDYEKVKVFLLKDGEKVIYSTYQSIEVIINAVKTINDFSFDLVVCDEAHRTAGSKDKNTFTLVHFDKNLPAKKRLYMTATPKIVSKKLKRKLGEDYELFCDMSNPEIFGDEAYHMTFGEAIDKKILVDYKIIGIGVTDRQIKQQIEERRYLGNYTADELANNYALDLVMSNYGAFHSLSFHSKVLYAQNFSKRHKDFFEDVYSKSVDGNQTTTLRSKILHEFRESPKGLVSNARCLTEGVDVPSIDLIYFCDPKSSVVDIVQASGRALRLDPSGKKEWGYIVVPIFHHEDQDVELEIKKKPIFQHLIQVIRSLCDHDERLRAEINEIAYKKGKNGNSRIKLDFSGSIIENIIKLEGIEEKVRNVLFDEIIEKTSSNWESRFQHLKEYIEKNGHSTISKKDIDNSDLYHWVTHLRKTYYQGRIENAKKKRLNEIDFDWKGENRREVNDSDENWRIMYSKSEAYFKEYGNSDIPARYIDKTLGTWAVTQRVKKKGNKLEDWQIELLNKINFNWKPQNQIDDFMEQIRMFKKENGHTRVMQSETNYGSLPRWVNRYRTIHNTGTKDKYGNIVSKHGKLPVEYIKQLDELGFLWLAVSQDWDVRYQELIMYFKTNGHSNVSTLDDQSLYFWCYSQRKNKDSLNSEKLEKLNAVNFDFIIRGLDNRNLITWGEKIEELSEFYNENGNFNIPKDNDQYKSLIRWLKKQRSEKLKNNLTIEQENWFRSIKFSLEDFFRTEEDIVWEVNLEKLTKYHKNTGSFHIKTGDKEFGSLLNWLRHQRIIYFKGNLSLERENKFKEIGYSFEISYRGKKGIDSISANYEPNKNLLNKLDELKSNFQKQGTFLIPNKNRENEALVNWVRYQKLQFRNGILGSVKTDLLNEINFPFNENLRGKSIKSLNREPNSRNHLIRPSIWDKRFEEFKDYYNQNKTFFIKTENKELQPLLRWINYQRILFKKDKLDTDKIDKLKQIGYSFNLDFRSRYSDDVNDWEIKLSQLKMHFEENGTFGISNLDRENEELLHWLNYQRLLKNNEKLSKEKIKAFEDIGYSFNVRHYVRIAEKKEVKVKVDNYKLFWESNYLKLLEYKMINGDCNVPITYKENRTLANFVKRQRSHYRINKLTQEQIDKLNFLGFEWVANLNDHYEIWINRYNELKRVFENTGSCNVSKKDNNILVNWIVQQRLKNRSGKLLQEEIELLNKIKFVWNPPTFTGGSLLDDDKWFLILQQLAEYKEIYGDCNVSQLNKDYKKLGRWLNDQRLDYSKGKLQQHRKELLEEIGIIWNAKENKFTIKLKMLSEYHQKYGHFVVKKSDIEFPGLYDWLHLMIKKGTTEERKNKLASIGCDISKLSTNDL